MSDSRAGGTELLVTTTLAAVAVGAVLAIDAYMQDDLQEPMAAAQHARASEASGTEDGARLDPRAACWGPFLSPECVPPLVPSDEMALPEHAMSDPVAGDPKLHKPRGPRLPTVQIRESRPAGISDRVFARVMEAWHGPRACATAAGDTNGTPTVRMRMSIDRRGRVKEARALDVDTSTEQYLASCLTASARGLRFPERRGETQRDATFVF